ncbi:MAG: glycosyltransferase family 2 protein [Bacteroidota bacterium]
MKVAVAILNWNGVKLLKRYLSSVVQHSKEATIYLIDNASTDDSVAWVKKNHPTINIIKFDKNYGYAGGYNLAMQQLEEEIVVLLNNDVEVTENWLKAIINLFQEKQEIAAIQPKILDDKKRNKFEYAGAAGGFIDWFAYPYCRGRVFTEIEKDKGQYNDEIEIFWASGACLAVRNSVYKQLNGFDETYFAHMEEIDLCWRMQNAGFQVYYTGKSEIFHLGGGTLNNQHPKKTFLNFRNSLFNLLKNAPSKNIYLKLFIRMLLDGLAAFSFLLQAKPTHFFAVLKAHFSFYVHFNEMLQKRNPPKDKKNYYKIKSIVWRHYLGK